MNTQAEPITAVSTTRRRIANALVAVTSVAILAELVFAAISFYLPLSTGDDYLTTGRVHLMLASLGATSLLQLLVALVSGKGFRSKRITAAEGPFLGVFAAGALLFVTWLCRPFLTVTVGFLETRSSELSLLGQIFRLGVIAGALILAAGRLHLTSGMADSPWITRRNARIAARLDKPIPVTPPPFEWPTDSFYRITMGLSAFQLAEVNSLILKGSNPSAWRMKPRSYTVACPRNADIAWDIDFDPTLAFTGPAGTVIFPLDIHNTDVYRPGIYDEIEWEGYVTAGDVLVVNVANPNIFSVTDLETARR